MNDSSYTSTVRSEVCALGVFDALGWLHDASPLAEILLQGFLLKLGRDLGESAAQVLKRIRLRGCRLEIELPEASEPTVVVLPEVLTDEARIAWRP